MNEVCEGGDDKKRMDIISIYEWVSSLFYKNEYRYIII